MSTNKLRTYNLKRKYRLTDGQYNLMLSEQRGCCKMCNKIPEEKVDKNGQTTPKGRLTVDHVTIAGVPFVRGLLCRECNLLLGNAYDDATTLSSGVHYLNTANATPETLYKDMQNTYKYMLTP